MSTSGSSLIVAVAVRSVWGAVAFARGRTAEDGEGEEWTKGRERTGNNTNAFFDDGPETDSAGTEHEFGWVAVETEIAQSDDCCAAGTWGKLESMHTYSHKGNSQSSHSENDANRKLDLSLHLNVPQQDCRQNCQSEICYNLNGREEETNIAVELEIA